MFIRDAFPRDVEARSVIDARAHDRKSESRIYAAGPALLAEVKKHRLGDNVSLVVIHGDDAVECGGAELRENDIARKRSRRIDFFPAEFLYRGNDFPAFLIAEKSMFTGVGIEPGDADPRMR